jgi:hypothetical protein
VSLKCESRPPWPHLLLGGPSSSIGLPAPTSLRRDVATLTHLSQRPSFCILAEHPLPHRQTITALIQADQASNFPPASSLQYIGRKDIRSCPLAVLQIALSFVKARLDADFSPQHRASDCTSMQHGSTPAPLCVCLLGPGFPQPHCLRHTRRICGRNDRWTGIPRQRQSKAFALHPGFWRLHGRKQYQCHSLRRCILQGQHDYTVPPWRRDRFKERNHHEYVLPWSDLETGANKFGSVHRCFCLRRIAVRPDVQPMQREYCKVRSL